MSRADGQPAECPSRLSYRLAEGSSGAPITDVAVSHERPMHLIAVRRDLAQFQHVHPQPTGQPGEYPVEVSFPTSSTYILYDEFARASGQDVLQRDELMVGSPNDAAGPAHRPPTPPKQGMLAFSPVKSPLTHKYGLPPLVRRVASKLLG